MQVPTKKALRDAVDRIANYLIDPTMTMDEIIADFASMRQIAKDALVVQTKVADIDAAATPPEANENAN